MNKALRAIILKEVIAEINKSCCGTLLDRQAVLTQLNELYEDANDTSHKRRIVCAANKFPDGTMILGVRHWDPIMREQARRIGYSEKSNGVCEQGFLDNHQSFVTREEAWVIANEAGQIIRRCGGDEGCLYSENLY